MNPKNIFNNSDPSLRSGLQKAWAIWFLLAIHAVVVLAGFIAPYSFETQDASILMRRPRACILLTARGNFIFVHLFMSPKRLRTV